MNREMYLEFCREIRGALVDQPFEGGFSSWIACHADTGKWFAAILEHDGRPLVNLKCDPIEGDFLKSAFQGIVPAYHMNKTHWITVYFDSDVSDHLLRELTLASFRLTDVSKKRDLY